MAEIVGQLALGNGSQTGVHQFVTTAGQACSTPFGLALPLQVLDLIARQSHPSGIPRAMRRLRSVASSVARTPNTHYLVVPRGWRCL